MAAIVQTIRANHSFINMYVLISSMLFVFVCIFVIKHIFVFIRLSVSLTINTFLVNQRLQVRRDKLESDISRLAEDNVGQVQRLCDDAVWLRTAETNIKASKTKQDGKLLRLLLSEKLPQATVL